MNIQQRSYQVHFLEIKTHNHVRCVGKHRVIERKKDKMKEHMSAMRSDVPSMGRQTSFLIKFVREEVMAK